VRLISIPMWPAGVNLRVMLGRRRHPRGSCPDGQCQNRDTGAGHGNGAVRRGSPPCPPRGLADLDPGSQPSAQRAADAQVPPSAQAVLRGERREVTLGVDEVLAPMVLEAGQPVLHGARRVLVDQVEAVPELAVDVGEVIG